MSNAHRPTWNPAQGREIKGGSRQYSNKDLAAHTKLKFRQPGQTSTSDLARVDLRTQLLVAERAALDKKRKAQGLPALPPLVLPGQETKAIGAAGAEGGEQEDEESRKRRKVLEEAVLLDRDDDDDDDEAGSGGEGGATKKDKGKGKAVDNGSDGSKSDSDADDDSDSSDDDDDDEDETAELLRELEKIKRERAEEKQRLESAAAEVSTTSREAEIATGNPLLNLAAALGQSGASEAGTTSTASGFSVKRRWDDDLIFKNQAVGTEDKGRKKEFVNDLLRTDFHRKFMGKFIK